jgi:hypothetical protein
MIFLIKTVHTVYRTYTINAESADEAQTLYMDGFSDSSGTPENYTVQLSDELVDSCERDND